MAFTREQHREYQAERRAKGREVLIPHVANPARRLECLTDPFLFLSTYMPERFGETWTAERRHIVEEIIRIATYGGDKAIAAPRKCGKTSIAEGVAGVYCPLKGLLRFPLICAATGPDATRVLANIKTMFDDPSEALEGDFPEVCAPILDLGGVPQKCNGQTVSGDRTRMHWSADYIQFPRVRLLWCPSCLYPESRERKGYRECPKCGKQFQPWMSVAGDRKISTRGLDSAIRGVRVGKDRPDFALIDDPETRESARSGNQCEVRELIIDNDIGGAGGGMRQLPRLVLTTIMYAASLSAKLTSRKMKPAFDGERIKLVSRWPDAKHLWDQYIDMRKEDQEGGGDQYGRRAHRFYEANREEMDAGGVVTNATRFDATILEDGTQKELSTLQFIHNVAADKGWDTVFAEYQNDPPDLAADEESRLTPFKVRGSHRDYTGRVSGQARKVVPDDCRCLTAFIDVQKRTLWYEVVAWRDGRRAHVVDYASHGDATLADVIGVAEAVTANLKDLQEHWEAEPYRKANGDAVPFNLVLVDSSFEPDAVRNLILRAGLKWRPARGEPKYNHPKHATAGKIPSRSGDRYYEASDGKIVVVHTDTVWWKHRCHDAFTVMPQEQPEGCVTLFGDNPKLHAEFGDQICAEEWREEFVEGKGLKAEWFNVRQDNHLLDCHVGNMVAASLCGIPVMQRKDRPRITLSQLQADRRG